MALRIRKDGKVLCAAIHEVQEGDIYIDDNLHYLLSAEWKVLLTEPHEKHRINGQWWWKGHVPDGVIIDDFYLEE